jgi:hypothetical protein
MVDCGFGATVFMMGVRRNRRWQIEHVNFKGVRGHSFGQFRFPVQDSTPAGDQVVRDYNEVGTWIN